MLDNVLLGLSVAIQPINLAFSLLGVLIGTLVGVLPGLGPLATMAMLLPITYYLTPNAALMMLAGIYYGSQYGGSTTAILAKLPGETSSAVTCIDGYQMARQGRAGAALAVAALSSFFAGTVSTGLIAMLSGPMAELGLLFQPAEYFSLMVLGLICAVVLARGSLLKAMAMILVGLMLGLVGTDSNSGAARLVFGIPALIDGLGVVPVAMGIFGISEVILSLSTRDQAGSPIARIARLWPSPDDFRRSWPAVLRGTAVGSMLGLLPGGGALLAAYAAYSIEKRLSKYPREFGTGAVEGVAGPESANNAAAQTSFIPMLTLGIPSNAIMAIMIGAMLIQGVVPGPQVMTRNPDIFWGLITSMWVGNLMLLVINLPLIGVWVQLLRLPYRFLFPSILLFCAIGVFTVGNASTDVLIMSVFGLVGVMFVKLGFEPAPMLLGFVLGPIMETNLRRAMTLSDGDPSVFVTRPISAGLLFAALLALALIALPAIRRGREDAFVE